MTCETIVTFRATGGGWLGSKPPESIVSDEPDYAHAVARARMDSLLPTVAAVQIDIDGQFAELWISGELADRR
jgi:hypothetical protein